MRLLSVIFLRALRFSREEKQFSGGLQCQVVNLLWQIIEHFHSSRRKAFSPTNCSSNSRKHVKIVKASAENEKRLKYKFIRWKFFLFWRSIVEIHQIVAIHNHLSVEFDAQNVCQLWVGMKWREITNLQFSLPQLASSLATESRPRRFWRLSEVSVEQNYRNYDLDINFWLQLTSIESPGVFCQSQMAYPGMHNIDDRAVNQPKPWAHHGNS